VVERERRWKEGVRRKEEGVKREKLENLVSVGMGRDRRFVSIDQTKIGKCKTTHP
jgi:hypothetical protein